MGYVGYLNNKISTIIIYFEVGFLHKLFEICFIKPNN